MERETGHSQVWVLKLMIWGHTQYKIEKGRWIIWKHEDGKERTVTLTWTDATYTHKKTRFSLISGFETNWWTSKKRHKFLRILYRAGKTERFSTILVTNNHKLTVNENSSKIVILCMLKYDIIDTHTHTNTHTPA